MIAYIAGIDMDKGEELFISSMSATIMSWRFLKNIDVDIPYDSVILLLGIYPKDSITCDRDIHLCMLIFLLFYL